MPNNIQIPNPKMTSNGSQGQSPPKKSPLRTFIVILWMALSLGLAIVSLYLIFNPNISDDDRALAIIASLGITGLIYIFAVVTKTVKTSIRITLFGIILILAGLFTYSFTNFFIFSLRIAVGIIALAFSLFMFINAVREHHDEYPMFGSILCGIIYLVLGIAILFSKDGTRVLAVLTGLYVLLLSLNTFYEALHALFETKPHLKKNFVVALPTFIAAFLPQAIYKAVNEMVKEEPDKLLKLQEPYNGEEPDLIVFIHTRPGFIPGFGHCDLCFNNKVYAYGDYDQSTWKLGGFLAAGTLTVGPPESHIKACLVDEKKVLIAYGLRLTDDLKKQVQEELDKIMSQTYVWKPQAQQALEGEINADPNSFKDVGSVMYMQEQCDFYKFKEGSQYRTYYALGENCSEVVNDVVGRTGINLLKPNGIITPGSYAEYMDELYEAQDSIVVDRRVYMLNNNGEPYLIPIKSKKHAHLGEMSI